MLGRARHSLDCIGIRGTDSRLRRVVVAVSLWLSVGAFASRGAEIVTVGGPSSQFVVTGPTLGNPRSSISSAATANRMLLDPAMVTVSCDRIKNAILRDLTAPDNWRGKVFVTLQPRWKPDAQILVTSAFAAGRWNYHVEIPNEVDKDRFLRVIVDVVMLEIANRNAGARLAEVPYWLTEGMMAHLRATALSTLLVQPETKIVAAGIKGDPLAEARALLRTRAPLTLDEMSWPKAGQLDGEAGRLYQACAQLFVTELLRLQNGPACLRDMLGLMPQYFNWQIAFLRAFGADFHRLVDVEKWWSLKLVQFTGRDPSRLWTRHESLQQLDDVLATPAQVRSSQSQLPAAARVPLQTVIQSWNSQRQLPVLRQKISQLQVLRLRVAPDVALLVNAYRATLEIYVQKRSNIGAGSSEKSQPPVSPRLLVRETLKQLGALDARREQLRQQRENNAVVQSGAKN